MEKIPESTICDWCKTESATLAYSTFDFFSCQKCYWDRDFNNERTDLMCGKCFQKPFEYVGYPPTCETCFMGHPPEGISCVVCKERPATMTWDERVWDHCADCYWYKDAYEKRKRRANPEWQFQAAYSSAITLFNKTEEEAVSFAIHTVIKRQLDEGKTKEEVTKILANIFENFNVKDLNVKDFLERC